MKADIGDAKCPDNSLEVLVALRRKQKGHTVHLAVTTIFMLTEGNLTTWFDTALTRGLAACLTDYLLCRELDPLHHPKRPHPIVPKLWLMLHRLRRQRGQEHQGISP